MVEPILKKKGERDMPKKSIDWLAIKVRWFRGEKISDLASEFGFSSKYWYRKYHQDWKLEKEALLSHAEEIVYQNAIMEEVDKREKIRQGYSSFLTKLFSLTVVNMNKIDELVKEAETIKEKFEVAKLIKITAEGIGILRDQQYDNDYIYTKSDDTGDPIEGEEITPPEVE